jgi:hypothetical protein
MDVEGSCVVTDNNISEMPFLIFKNVIQHAIYKIQQIHNLGNNM